MYTDKIPGQVIHIQMEGTAAKVFFLNVPGALVIPDLDAVLRAFDASDWSFFHDHWWAAHAYLKESSCTLRQLANKIDPDQFFSASTLLDQAREAGIYQGRDAQALERDRERLAILCHVHQGFREVEGIPLREGGRQRLAWPGAVWSMALSDQECSCRAS